MVTTPSKSVGDVFAESLRSEQAALGIAPPPETSSSATSNDPEAYVRSLFDTPLPTLQKQLAELAGTPEGDAIEYVADQKFESLFNQVNAVKGYENTVRTLAELKRDNQIDDRFIDAITELVKEKAREPLPEVSLKDAKEFLKALPDVGMDIAKGLYGVARYAPQAAFETVKGAKIEELNRVRKLVGAEPLKPGDEAATKLMSFGTLQGTYETGRLVQRLIRLATLGVEDFDEASIKERLKEDLDLYDTMISFERGQSKMKDEATGAYQQVVPEELVEFISPVGEVLSLDNVASAVTGALVPKIGAQAAAKVGKKIAVAAPRLITQAEKNVAEAAAKTAAEKAVSLPRRAIGTAVEKTGEIAGTPTGRATTAAVATAAMGGSPGAILFSAIGGGSRLGQTVLKAGPEAVKATGRAIKAPLTGPIGELANVTKDLVKGGVAGTATMAPLALPAETAEERGTLLAGGFVAGGFGAGVDVAKNSVRQLGRSLWTASDKVVPETERAPITAYGTPDLDKAHADYVRTLPADMANRVEALRDIVGTNNEIYVIDPTTYDSLDQTQAGGAKSQGVVFATAPNGKNIALIRGGSESLLHETGHVVFNSLPDAEKAKLRDAVLKGYKPEELEQMREYYVSRGIDLPTQDALVEEVLAENFQVALNGGPLGRLGTPRSLAGRVYGTVGTLAERVGLRNLVPGADVVTSQTLQFTPSFIAQNAIRSMLEARDFDLSGTPPAGVTAPPPAAPAAPVAPPPAAPAAPVAPPPAAPAAPVAPPPAAPAPTPTAAAPAAPVPAPQAAPTAPVAAPVAPAAPAPGLTPEAQALIDRVDQGGAAPAFISRNLERIATENNVEITGSMTPNDVVQALRQKAAPVAAPAETPRGIYATPAQREEIATQEATPEVEAANRQTLATELAKPRADRRPIQVGYNSAKADEARTDGPLKLSEPQRAEQRALADAGEAEGVADQFREVYDKVTIPYKAQDTKKGGTTLFAFSLDKVIRNIDMLGAWLRRNPEAAASLAQTTGVQSLESPEFRTQFQNYLQNQANGYRGDGRPLTKTPDTRAEDIPDPTPGYTPVPVPEGASRLINSLMGLRNAIDYGEGATAAQSYVQRLAKANGAVVAEVREMPGRKAGEMVTTNEFNLVNKELRDLGFDTNLFHVAIEQLRLKRIATPITFREDLNVRAPLQGVIQIGFMPSALPIPERFTGTGEEAGRRGEKVTPPAFFNRYGLEGYIRGGKYVDTGSGEDITGRVYQTGSIDVSTGRPNFQTSDTPSSLPTSGRKIRTNLFKQSAGWKWIGEAPSSTTTLVSVEIGKDHLYTLNAQFDTPVELTRYSEKKKEPRLRPTTLGVLQVGEKVGEIKVRGRIHPVYDKVTTATDAPGRGIVNRGEDSRQFMPAGNDETTQVASDYVRKAFRREYEPHTTYDQVPEDLLKEIADYFQNVAKHEPDSPEVLRAYQAMADETIEQYKAMIDAGIEPEPYDGVGEPYASSEEMMRDVRENKHLYFLRTDSAFGQGTQDSFNPLLEKSGLKIGDFELLVNDVFRIVHDYFGHTQQGLQFGPRGELNAWKSHSRMYSDAAQGAVAAETLAQNAWVNFGQHLRRDDGSIPKKGDPDYVPPQDRPFGEQKNFLVPPDLIDAALGPTNRNLQFMVGETTAPETPLAEETLPTPGKPLSAISTEPEKNLAAGLEFTPKASEIEIEDASDRVSTRVPTAKKATENALTSQLVITSKDVVGDTDAANRVASLIRSYPGTPKGIKSSKALIAEFKRQISDNLVWLHDLFDAELRERAKRWYDGARKITEDWSNTYDIPRVGIAGALASLSPQKDWFMNVDLARRVIEHRARLINETVTQEMVDWFKAKFGEKEPELLQSLQEGVGKSFNDIGLLERAVIIRAYDELYSPRSYQIVTPEGTFSGPARNANGSLSKVAWGGFSSIAKALSCIENPTRSNVSLQLGEEHKVRNFYNNILLPNETNFGDVTIDTHAVAAGLLRPLAGGDIEVAHNLGAGYSSALTGASGIYGVYADAYRDAAERRGRLPREMQSITWEAIRLLFTPEFKTATNKARVNAVWKQVKEGKISPDEARKQIYEIAGGIGTPSWK